MASFDLWKEFPLHAEVTNGEQYGRIVPSPFISERTGDYLPMVRVDGLVRKVWPWSAPRWRVLSEAEAEARHWAREDARRAADLASEPVDNRRTRGGAVLPKWRRPVCVTPADNATEEQRAALDQHRGGDWNPFE